MDMLNLAVLASWLAARYGSGFDRYDMVDLQQKVQDCQQVNNGPYISAEGVRTLVSALADSSRRIEAIKKYRDLTGDSLEDAKWAIEAVINHNRHGIGDTDAA